MLKVYLGTPPAGAGKTPSPAAWFPVLGAAQMVRARGLAHLKLFGVVNIDGHCEFRDLSHYCPLLSTAVIPVSPRRLS